MAENDREELRKTAERLREARETAGGEAATRLGDYAEQADEMAEADRGPDHGRLARFEHNLNDVKEELDAEGADLVDEALSHERNYRETVEGV